MTAPCPPISLPPLPSTASPPRRCSGRCSVAVGFLNDRRNRERAPMIAEKIPATVITGLPRRRQDDAHPPSPRQCLGPPPGAHHQRVRRRRRRRRNREGLRHARLQRGGRHRACQRLHLLHRRRRFHPRHVEASRSRLAARTHRHRDLGPGPPPALVRAFHWPEIRSRVTVDGVVTVVDGAAVADGRFAADEAALAAQRAADPSLDHDSPIAELFDDQLACADMVLLNKSDLLEHAVSNGRKRNLRAKLRPGTRLIPTTNGRIDVEVLLGLASRPRTISPAGPRITSSPAKPSTITTISRASSSRCARLPTASAYLARIRGLIASHDVLRLKGFLAVEDVASRLLVQAVGPRLDHYFDRPWRSRRTPPGQSRRHRPQGPRPRRHRRRTGGLTVSRCVHLLATQSGTVGDGSRPSISDRTRRHRHPLGGRYRTCLLSPAPMIGCRSQSRAPARQLPAPPASVFGRPLCRAHLRLGETHRPSPSRRTILLALRRRCHRGAGARAGHRPRRASRGSKPDPRSAGTAPWRHPDAERLRLYLGAGGVANAGNALPVAQLLIGWDATPEPPQSLACTAVSTGPQGRGPSRRRRLLPGPVESGFTAPVDAACRCSRTISVSAALPFVSASRTRSARLSSSARWRRHPPSVILNTTGFALAMVAG